MSDPILRVRCPLCLGPVDVDWRGDHGILLDHRRVMTGGLYADAPDDDLVVEDCDVMIDCPLVGAMVKRRFSTETEQGSACDDWEHRERGARGKRGRNGPCGDET